MPRVARSIEPSLPYHAMDRGNRPMAFFDKAADYGTFARRLGRELDRYAVELFAYGLMRNL